MDTPERNQIGTPLSKFEDSPVFNYINSLSPIKPVKSLHITQAFSSISFASLPSIFSSPHVSVHKESRFLRRHCISDPSKPECSENENGNEGCTGEGVVLDAAEQYNKSAMLHENFDTAITVGEASAEQDNDDSNFVIELPQNLKYDCGSPDCESAPSGIQMDSVVELDDQFASLVPYVQETSQKGSSDGEAQVQETCLIEQKHNPAVRDWEGLICDTSDLLIFNSPSTTESLKGLIETSSEPVRGFYDSITPQLPPNGILDEQNTHSSDLVNYSEQQKAEDISSQPGEAVSLEQTEQVQGPTAITCLNNCVVSEKMDGGAETCTEITCMSVLNLHRGLRRRCLDFDQAGGRRKNFGNGSTSNSSSISSQSDEIINLSDKQLVQFKPGGDSRCILPGIGLHLNALASNSKDYRKPNNENLSCGSHPGTLSTTTAYHPNTADQEHLHKSGTSDCSEIDTDIEGNGVQLMHDACQEQAFLDSKEFNQNSPKKKRRKIENVGDSEMACKRCNCKKSKCLKLYCECFAAGLYCTEPCSCQDCFNKPIHEDTVLATRKQIESRNPLAFAPKVIRSSDSVPEYRLQDESSKTPASARHKRGCNCKKSNCLKKYCECYQGGVGCSIGCRCEGCKNAFGRKDVLTGIEAELDEDENEACEKSLVDKPEIPNNRGQNPSASLPITPLRLSRQLVPLSFSSKGKPPRSSFLTITSSSGLYGGQKLGKPNIQQSHPKFLKKMQSAPEDEMPEILRGDCSPSTGIKTSSPNSKRISPPQCDIRSSPARRSGRKLILQSIPSFPSLTLTPRR